MASFEEDTVSLAIDFLPHWQFLPTVIQDILIFDLCGESFIFIEALNAQGYLHEQGWLGLL